MNDSKLVIVLMCFVSACSPYDYSKQVSAISTGVDQISTGFNAGYTGLATDRAALAQLYFTDNKFAISVSSSCALQVNPSEKMSQLPCVLMRTRTPEPDLSDVDQKRQRISDVIKALKGYANALAAVTNASDRKAYDASVSQLSGAVGGLVKSADPALPGVSAVVPAAINLGGWLVGTALDEQRFESLKSAVNAVNAPISGKDSAIHIVTITLGIGLEAIVNSREVIVYQEATALTEKLSNKLSDAVYRQRLTDAESAITLLNSLRQSDPAGTAASLETAHNSLVKAVNDPNLGYSDLVTAVGNFVDKATAVQSALSAKSAPPNTSIQKGS